MAQGLNMTCDQAQINAGCIDLTKNRGEVGFEVFRFNLMMCEMHMQKKKEKKKIC